MEKVKFANDEATNKWLSNLKESTKWTYKSYWSLFLKHSGMTGNEILKKKKESEENWGKRLLDFKEWMVKEKGYAEKSAATATQVVRSFFTHHNESLKLRRRTKKYLKEGKPKYQDYRFSVKDLQKMADVAELKEKYVIIVGKSFGLRAGDFLTVTRGDLEAYIDREPPIGIGEFQTQKKKVLAYPFIDRDAKPVIKLMLEKMDRDGRTDSNERMLGYEYTKELTRVLKRIAERAGIEHGSKKIRFHCLRKFLTDRLSGFMSESKWKQVVGKAISEGAYVSEDLLREAYARTQEATCFSTVKMEGVGAELRRARSVLKGLGFDADRLLRKARIKEPGGKAEFLWERIGEIMKTRGKVKKKEQAIVEEEKLGNHLSHGWRFVAALGNGRCVVEK